MDRYWRQAEVLISRSKEWESEMCIHLAKAHMQNKHIKTALKREMVGVIKTCEWEDKYIYLKWKNGWAIKQD